MNVPAVRVEGVAKKYCRRLRHTMLYGTVDLLRAFVGAKATTGLLRPGEFWAVEDLGFVVRPGECIGLVGPNGSGKSTLLKLVGGVFMPDRGRITVRGRLGALIEVGAGFHPLLTGRENIYVNAAIQGLSRREVDRRLEAIIDFADLGEFIDLPIKHYSSGMFVRLGFSVAVHCTPEVLLIDEVLAVGDARFQRKCFERLSKLRSAGCAVVLVSHDMNAITVFCDQALLLARGHLVTGGRPGEVVKQYYKHLTVDESPGARPPISGSPDSDREIRYGSGEARIIDCGVLDPDGHPVETLMSGEEYRFFVVATCSVDVQSLHFGMFLRTLQGIDLFGANTVVSGVDIGSQRMGTTVRAEFAVRVFLAPGAYCSNFGVFDSGFRFYDRRLDAILFRVLSRAPIAGGACAFPTVIDCRVTGQPASPSTTTSSTRPE